MSVEDAEVIHKQADKDGDGEVSLDEYLEAIANLPSAPDLDSLSTNED